MKIIRTAVAAVALCATMNPAWAGDRCATPDDALALKTAAIQQQLMVAAFTCHDADAYNRFVMAYQGELQRSDAVLKAFFVHRGGRHGQADYDSYKTKAANLYALSEARDDRAFCAVAGELFAAALATQSPLAAFVAAAPSAPGFAEICVQHVAELRADETVRVAQRSTIDARGTQATPGR